MKSSNSIFSEKMYGRTGENLHKSVIGKQRALQCFYTIQKIGRRVVGLYIYDSGRSIGEVSP